MVNSSSPRGDSAGMASGGYTATIWERVRAFLLGLSPLAPVALIVFLTTLLTPLARQLTAGAGFYTQQWASVILVTLDLILAIASVIICSVRAFRTIRRWEQSFRFQEANLALLGLVVFALVLVLPVVLAILAPQHPAPNLPS